MSKNTPAQNNELTCGDYKLQLGSAHGSVVDSNPSEQTLPPAKPLPVSLLPLEIYTLVGRKTEIEAVLTAIETAQPLEFYGEPGIGKTSLLRYFAHDREITSTSKFPDGVVYLAASSKPLTDLLQLLFDAFYESNPSWKPTDSQIRNALQNKQGIIFLDDVNQTEEELQELIDIAPQCSFLFFSTEKHLSGEGLAIALQGLSPEEGASLIENELGRSLEPDEKSAAQQLSTKLEGHPQKMLQLISPVKQGESSLTEVLNKLDQINEEVLADKSALKKAQEAIAGNPIFAKLLDGIGQADTASSIWGSATDILAGEASLEEGLEELTEVFGEDSMIGQALQHAGGLINVYGTVEEPILSALSHVSQGLPAEHIAGILSHSDD